MSRITHCSYFPLNIDYWDYYILCGLNIEAARILQRLEFWDGTKGEESHDGASLQHSRFIWKSEEELSWELMGSCGEKRLAACLYFLIHDRQYVVSRANPVRRFDRTKQYAVQVQRIQSHLNKLDTLIKTFLEAGRQLRPAQYAIELLTRKGIPIEELTVEQIADQLAELHQIMQEDDERRATAPHRSAKTRLPTFIRLHLHKDEAQGFCASSPLGTTSVSIPHNDGIESSSGQHRDEQGASLDMRGLTGAIPENTSENPSRQRQTEQMTIAQTTAHSSLHETAPAAPGSLKKTDDNASAIDAQQKADEAQHLSITADDIISVFEQKQGKAYDEKMRQLQLASARILLNLQLPLTAEAIGHIYDECCDDWWREHYGTLHVSHLVECERSHGQPRIVRLLQRVQAKARWKMHPPAQVSSSSTPISSLPVEMLRNMPDVLQHGTITGSATPNGWTGWAYSDTDAEPVCLVQWNGAIVPLDDALKAGYNGGWERFRPVECDDLDALVRKYQAQGILPHNEYLNEGANNDESCIAH